MVMLHMAYGCQAHSRWLGSSQQINSNCVTESVSLSAKHRTSHNHQPLCSFPTIFSLDVTRLRVSLSLFRVNKCQCEGFKTNQHKLPNRANHINFRPKHNQSQFKTSKSHILNGLSSISGLSWEVWLEL